MSSSTVEPQVQVLLDTIAHLNQLLKEAHRSNQMLTTEVQLLNEKVDYLMGKRFGRSKETLGSEVSGQISLFPEDAAAVLPSSEETSEITVSSHQRRKKGQKASKISHLPQREVHHRLKEEGTFCDHCGTPMKEIGSTRVREEILFHQAALECLQHQQHSYCCPRCEKEGISSFKKAPLPKPLVPNSLGSNSLIVETIRMKFVQKIPAYRQEDYWHQVHGLEISRANIVHWHQLAVTNALDPIARRLHHYLLQEEILHADETSYRVIQSQKATTYYWLFCSGKESEHPITYYQHAETRAGKVPRRFLKGFSGMLTCDGYGGYNEVENVTLAYCWAHVRRKFFDAIPKKNKNQAIPAVQAVQQIDAWFRQEKKWQTLSPQERRAQRREEMKPQMEVFFDWLETFTAVEKSKLAIAVHYVRNHRAGLERIFEDGRLEMSNNRAERAIKELVMGRKNWMHSTSLEGARTSGILLSLCQTAKANGLDPTRYLEFLFDRIPNLPTLTEEALDRLLPWTSEVQEKCCPLYQIKK